MMAFLLRFTSALFCLIAILGAMIGCQKSGVHTSTQTKTQAAIAPSPQELKKLKARLNRILYWQIADELDLKAEEEKKMVRVLQDVQTRREKALREREGAFQAMRRFSRVKNSDKSVQALRDHVKSFKELAQADSFEYEELKGILGEERLARFYVIRSEMGRKIKRSIQSP